MATRFFPNYNANKITSKFGMRTMNGKTKMHNGIDLVAKRANGGSATDYITAHTGGKVSASGYDSSAGYYVNIKVSNTTTMVYYHLKAQSNFKKGDLVNKGDVLGYMGSTGNSSGAHLHWGIKKSGKWIDPEPYLDKDYTEGKEVLTVDGKWGKATTKRLQHIFGTSADSKVSNQWAKYKNGNPGLTSGWEWKTKPNGKGSQLIKAMQKWAGMAASDQDGEIGTKTITAFQKKLGTVQDGCVSNPSSMVKALQKWANEQ